jgi:hypothetical protein
MPLTIDRISLWPVRRHLEDPVRMAVEAAGADCRADENWTVSVWEGPEVGVGAAKVTLLGGTVAQILWNDWIREPDVDGAHEYSTVIGAGQVGLAGTIEERLRRFLRGPR